MQKPTKPPEDSKMTCPNCGSAHVVLDETAEVISTNNHAALKQYNCGDCNAKFIPAVINEEKTNITKWAKTMRTSEGLNEGKAWGKQKVEYIIILPKKNK